MKLIVKHIIFCLAVSGFYGSSITAQCPFSGNNGGSITPVLNVTTTLTCVTPGDYLVIPVDSGHTYVFDACANAAAALELTLFNDIGSNYIGYANSGCPNGNPKLNFVAYFTGTVLLQLNTSGCAIGGTCLQLDVLKTASPPIYEACQPITSVCGAGGHGPYVFGSRGFKPNDCLYWSGSVAYVLLNVAVSGSLNLLIEGNVGVGFLDVSLYDVPSVYNPCHAIDPSNLISCNQAISQFGCIELGSCFGACSGSIISAPFVNAGQQIILIVENYSNIESSFTINVGTCTGSAQLGPPTAMLPSPAVKCRNEAHFLVEPVHMGGIWSSSCNNCIDSESGYFNPLVAGLGSHSVSYQVGSGGCQQTASTVIQVQECCTPLSFIGLPPSIPLGGGDVQLSVGNTQAHTPAVLIEMKSNYGHSGLLVEILENGVAYLNYSIPVNTHFQGRFYQISPSQLNEIRLCEGASSVDGGDIEFIVRNGQSGTILFADTWVMDGNCQIFNLTPTFNVSGVSQWSSNSTGLINTTDWGFAVFDPNSAGQGTWDVTYCWDDNVNCSSCTTQTVVVTCNQPVISVNALNALCQTISDGSIQITTTGGAGGYTYYLEGLGQSGGASHVFPNIAYGNYSVWVTDQTGCTSDTSIVQINANTNFFPAITTLPDTCNRGVGAIQVVVSSGQPPILFAIDSGIYQSSGDFYNVSEGLHYILIIDATGCGQIEEIEVFNDVSERCDPKDISTAFSPNGDGINDTWIIPELSANVSNSVVIFDRWGGVIREFQNYNNSTMVWEGLGKKGQIIPSGTYFYTIEIPETNRSMSGWVHLIR